MKKTLFIFVLGLLSLGFVKAQTNTYQGDTHILGSMAIGYDVDNPTSFGFNTLVLKESNLRLLFDDSTDDGSSFPFNDWKITINDSSYDGDSFFRIDDVTGGFEPFKLMAGSRTNALVTKGSKVGLGTNDPALDLHIIGNNSPGIRLQQKESAWGDYIWDLGANETNFFVRDVINGSKLPFRVAAGQVDNVLTLRNNRVGIGTWGTQIWAPSATLHLNGFMRFEPMNAAPDTPGAGDLYFDKTSSELRAYDGTNWLNLGMNTDSQELSISSHVLSITNGTNTFDLSGYLDNTDSQTLDLSGNSLSVSNGNTVDLSSYLDNTDAQELSISSDVLSISGGTNTIDLFGYLDNTDSQTLDLSDNILSISNGNSVDLSSYLNNTDAQNISLSGTSLSIDNGNSVDLSALQDGYEANTDAQELSVSSHVLSITNGTNTFDLSGYLDNTDSQTLDLSGNSLSISNGNSLDLSSYLDNTDAQNISLSGTLLSIDNGNTVDLSMLQDGYEANTDKQTLSLSGTTLGIENGNSVDLNSLLESINAQLADQKNTIEQLESKATEQENTIAQLQAEIENLKSLYNNNDDTMGAILYQNYPNPTNGTTRIDYFVPETASKASLMVYDLRGRLAKNISLNSRGKGSVEIAGSELENGQYMYTLLIDGSRTETKKMLIVDNSF